MKVSCYYGEPPIGWDQQLYSAQREAGLGQSLFWARVLHRVDGVEPLFLTVEDNQELLGQLLLFRKPPFDRKTRRRLSRLSAWRMGAQETLEWLDAPVIHTPQLAAEILGVLLEWIEAYARERSIGIVRSLGWAGTSRFLNDPETLQVFDARGYLHSGWATLLVDLTASEDQLWRNLDHAARKSLKRCEREGVKVRRIADFEDFVEKYYTPYVMTEKAYGRRANPLNVAQVMFEEDTEKYYSYFVAESAERETLATLGMYSFNGVTTEIASALTPIAFERKIPAQDILHWEMMKYAKAQGCHTFNLGGVAPEPHDVKEAGIRRFKEKWGGQYVEYYRFEKATGAARVWHAIRPLAGHLKRSLTRRLPASGQKA